MSVDGWPCHVIHHAVLCCAVAMLLVLLLCAVAAAADFTQALTDADIAIDI